MLSRSQLTELKKKVDDVQELMIDYVTDGRNNSQPKEYRELYYILEDELEEAGYSNPNPHSSLEELWSYCKATGELDTYASRRTYVRDLYSEVIREIQQARKQTRVPRNWHMAEAVLIDEFMPIRYQWSKAKRFLEVQPPDYENAIKEAVNSIESALKIITGNTNATMGQLVKQVDIDEDIQRILSQTYGLVSNKAFVRHGAIEQQQVDRYDAEFFVELAATAIIYLKNKLRTSQPT